MGDFWADVDTKKWVYAMRMVGREALPRAIAGALNDAAAASALEAQRNVKRSMTVRTPYTLRSIRQDRTARGANLQRMHSRVSSISPYLAIHDEGGVRRAKGRAIPIRTLSTRSGGSWAGRIMRRYYSNVRHKNRFAGVPKGRGGRRFGVYERYANNKRLRMIANLETSSANIRANRWFSNAIARYGTPQYIRARFIQHAQRELARVQR